MSSKFSRLFLGVTLQLFMQLHVYSQQDDMLLPKLHIPSSPEAAMIERFGDIPVSYYSGTANISVPLYTVKEGDIEIPITLNYHSSGIKVADEATWVGLGWDLSPGGTIIQEVRGKEDFYDQNLNMLQFPDAYNTFKAHLGPIGTGAFYSAFQTGDCLKEPTSPGESCGSADDNTGILYKLQEGEGQPDIYNYNFNGNSGKFYINPETHEIVLMDIKTMIYFENLGVNGWRATTLDGTSFEFHAIETSTGYVHSEVKGITYKLTNIYMLNGRSVSFNYTDESSVSEIYSESYTFHDVASQVAKMRDYTYSNKKTLTSIVTTDATINFNLENREDIISSSINNIKRLKSIDIKSNSTNKKIRSFDFEYGYFTYNLTGARYSSPSTLDPYTAAHLDGYGKRLKLMSVKEIGYDNNDNRITDKPPYAFTYDESVIMPVKNSFAVDFWGYYNGAGEKTLLPNLDYFDYPHDIKYLDENYGMPNLIDFIYPASNRYTNNALAGANMLKKLTYPTGGYTEFTYEPNTFSNVFIPVQSDPIFKNLTAKDNSNIPDGSTSVHFKLSKKVFLHFENDIYNGTGNQNQLPPLTASDMLGCYIKLYKFKLVNGVAQNTLLNTWDLSGVTNADFAANGKKHWSEDVPIEFDPDPNPDFDYRLEAYFPNSLNNTNYGPALGVESHVTFYDNTGVDATQSKQCGMRIKEIKNYSQEGQLTGHKLIQYSGGKLLDGFEPLQTMFSVNNTVVHNNDGSSDVFSNFRKRTWISSGDIASGNIGYDKVEEIELPAWGTGSKGKNIYFYFNQENLRRKGYPSNPNIQNGLVVKQQVFDNTDFKQIEKVYLYTSLYYPHYCYSGITIKNHITGGSDWTRDFFSNGNSYVPYFTYKYSYGIYPMLSEWWKIKKLTTTNYSNGTELTTEESYTYNSEGSPDTIRTVNSKGETLTTKYYYPQDNLINNYADNYMVTVHNTGTPVITEKYNDNTLLTREKIEYGDVGDAPTLLPQYIFKQYGDNGPEDRVVKVDKYDDKGNILQYTTKNDIPVSLIWNTDKTLPVAKIENATYQTLLDLPDGLASDFRTLLPHARVTSYTYKPLVGVLSITDADNRTASYEYDDFGRLKIIRDKDGNILKKYEYQYHQ